MAFTLNNIASLGASLLRPTRRAVAIGHRRKPRKMLELCEAEHCPYCRFVRETLTELGLDAKVIGANHPGAQEGWPVRQIVGRTRRQGKSATRPAIPAPDLRPLIHFAIKHGLVER
jgi:glutaredoxin